MTGDEAILAARREALLRRSADLRSGIAADAAAIANRLRIVDRASGFFGSGYGRIAVWGGLLLLLIAGPRTVLKFGGRAALAWPLVRRWLPGAVAHLWGRRRV